MQCSTRCQAIKYRLSHSISSSIASYLLHSRTQKAPYSRTNRTQVFVLCVVKQLGDFMDRQTKIRMITAINVQKVLLLIAIIVMPTELAVFCGMTQNASCSSACTTYAFRATHIPLSLQTRGTEGQARLKFGE